jgi:hypothetical protein
MELSIKYIDPVDRTPSVKVYAADARVQAPAAAAQPAAGRRRPWLVVVSCRRLCLDTHLLLTVVAEECVLKSQL